MPKIHKVFYLLITASIILIDQYTKSYVRSLFISNTSIEINCFLNIVSTWNSGISFGIFNNFPGSNLLFLFTTIVIVIILCFVFVYFSGRSITVGSALILGGAVGNLIDRFRFNAVYDFIDFHVNGWHWPAFNVADSMVCLGVMILFIGEWSGKKN